MASSNVSEENKNDLSKLSKPELIAKCADAGITKCNSKTK